MLLDVIVKSCAILGASLGLYNFFAAIVKQHKESKLKASLNLVKAEYRKGKTETGQRATYLYVINSDIRPVSSVRVEFLRQNGEPVSKKYPSLPFGGECCVDFFTMKQPRFMRARFMYWDYDGRQHVYEQDEIHENPHDYAAGA